MSTIKQAVANSAKITGKFALRYFLLVASGLLLSLVLCIALFPEWQSLFHSQSGLPAAGHTGVLGAVLAFYYLCISSPVGMFVLLAFTIGFPFLYHTAAMKGAVSHALNYVVRTNKAYLVEYPVAKFKGYIQSKGAYNPAQLSLGQVNEYVQKLSGMNRASRICFRFIADKLPMGDMIYETITSGEISVQDIVNQYVDENFAQSKPTLYFIVLTIHILVFTAVKVIY